MLLLVYLVPNEKLSAKLWGNSQTLRANIWNNTNIWLRVTLCVWAFSYRTPLRYPEHTLYFTTNINEFRKHCEGHEPLFKVSWLPLIKINARGLALTSLISKSSKLAISKSSTVCFRLQKCAIFFSGWLLNERAASWKRDGCSHLSEKVYFLIYWLSGREDITLSLVQQ